MESEGGQPGADGKLVQKSRLEEQGGGELCRYNGSCSKPYDCNSTNPSTTTIFSLNQDDGSLLDPSIYLSVPVCPSSHMRMDAPRSATPYLKVFMSAVSWRPVSLRSLP